MVADHCACGPRGPAQLPAAGAQVSCPAGRFVFSRQAEALAMSCG